ncbi:MAG: phytanoyl-CoA dioxygenase family protein [Rubripirellula sp.]|nr:phytanoyl-CoA dioxygenase family protein [Rubripirellula sp.]
MIHEEKCLDRYRADGFVVDRQFLSPTEVDELVGHVQRYICERIPLMPSEQVFYEDREQPESLKQIQQMWKHDDYFHSLITEGKFRSVAEKCLQGPVIPKNLQYFNKSPGVNQSTPVHQDAFYFMLDPPLALTMWLALDEVDEENGCVRYIPGSHRQPLRLHQRTGTLGFSQGITDYPLAGESDREVPVRARPGDLLVHDAMTIHRADGNRSSKRTRRALGMIYYSERAKEDTAGHARYQRQLASEMKSKGRV